MQFAISVDVEEYFHAANLSTVAGPHRWHCLLSRVEYATDLILSLFAEFKTKGTFFILGTTARRHPSLVKRIVNAGHEIGSHGYSHQLVYNLNERQFFRDITRTKSLLEDLAGTAVIGYRAPNFSITDASPWALPLIAKAGYLYDSSRHPIWHPRYANERKALLPEKLATDYGHLFLFPLAAIETPIPRIRLPIAGGAYWRLLPRSYTISCLKFLQAKKVPVVCYLHPWEFDCEQPEFTQLSAVTRFRHYGKTKQFSKKVALILKQFSFAPIKTLASSYFGAVFERT